MTVLLKICAGGAFAALAEEMVYWIRDDGRARSQEHSCVFRLLGQDTVPLIPLQHLKQMKEHLLHIAPANIAAKAPDLKEKRDSA